MQYARLAHHFIIECVLHLERYVHPLTLRLPPPPTSKPPPCMKINKNLSLYALVVVLQEASKF